MDIVEELKSNDYIINEIKKRLSSTKDITAVISTHLNLSKSAVYRKLSSEVPFTFQEVMLLARFYGISLDNCIHAGSSCTGFQFPFHQSKYENDLMYYEKIHKLLQKQLNANINEEGQMFILTQEIVPFYYMYFPELTSFQILLWSKATMRLDQTEEQQYKIEERAHDPSMRAVSEKIVKAYNAIPSTEFISSSLLDQNLSAIAQFAHQPYFEDKHTPMLICEQLESMIKFVFQMAKVGHKFHCLTGEKAEDSTKFTLYHDPLANYGTSIYFRSKEKPMVYTALDFPNYMSSTATNMLQYMERWVSNCRTHSYRMSGEGEMYRTQLLQSFLKKIDATKKMLG